MRLRRPAPLALVLALGLALVATLTVGLAAWSWAQGQDQPRARTVAITIHWSRFQPSEVRVAQGSTVRFVIRNTDPIDHEFILGDLAVQEGEEAGTDLIHDGTVPGMVSAPAGRTVATVVSFARHPAERSLVYACHLPGHYAYGMRGVLTITS